MAKKAATPATYMEAWAPKPPTDEMWTARPWVHPSARVEEGHLERKRVPRTSHGAFEPRAGRDPIAILDAQEADRLPDLVPLRHARMAESPFAYYRGTPAVMAFDLADHAADATSSCRPAATPTSRTSACSPRPSGRSCSTPTTSTRRCPAPWEWDVKRLAASVVIAGRANGFSAGAEPRGDDGHRPLVPRVDGPLRRRCA